MTRIYIAGPMLTAQIVRAAVDYDPLTGIFRWREGGDRRRPAGEIAGGRSSEGYWRICINGERHQAHRLAWLYVHGEWPTADIDHRDANKLNNRIENLREASGVVNAQNKRIARIDNKSGLLGVSRDGARWRAAIHVNGRQKRLGSFPTPEAAHECYVAAKRQLHEGNTL